MSNYITLNRKTHISVLADHRIDPVTKELLKVGDEVCACAKCKTIYSRKVWDSVKRKTCCDQNKTLSEIPNTEYINFEKKTDEQEKKNDYGCAFAFFLITTIGLGIATWYWYDEFLREQRMKESYSSQVYREKTMKESSNSKVLEREKIIQNVVDYYAPILINNVEFKADEQAYGSSMYSDSKYIKPRIGYTSLSKLSTTIELYVKIYKPDGSLFKAEGVTGEYTFSNSISIEGNYNKSANLTLSGFGNQNGDVYSSYSTYKYEIWYKKRILYSTSFYVRY